MGYGYITLGSVRVEVSVKGTVTTASVRVRVSATYTLICTRTHTLVPWVLSDLMYSLRDSGVLPLTECTRTLKIQRLESLEVLEGIG